MPKQASTMALHRSDLHIYPHIKDLHTFEYSRTNFRHIRLPPEIIYVESCPQSHSNFCILDKAGYNTLPWAHMGSTDTLLVQMFHPPCSTYASISITPILWSPNFAELQEQNKVRN